MHRVRLSHRERKAYVGRRRSEIDRQSRPDCLFTAGQMLRDADLRVKYEILEVLGEGNYATVRVSSVGVAVWFPLGSLHPAWAACGGLLMFPAPDVSLSTPAHYSPMCG